MMTGIGHESGMLPHDALNTTNDGRRGVVQQGDIHWLVANLLACERLQQPLQLMLKETERIESLCQLIVVLGHLRGKGRRLQDALHLRYGLLRDEAVQFDRAEALRLDI